MEVTKAWDGEECLEQVLSHDPLYYSVIVVSPSFLTPLANIYFQPSPPLSTSFLDHTY